MTRAQRVAGSIFLVGVTILAGCLAPPPKGNVLVVKAGGAQEFALSPAILQANVGQPVTIQLENVGAQPHTLTNHDFHVHTGTVEPGASAAVTFTPNQVGSFTFLCDLPGHAAGGMQVTLEVS